MSVMGWDPVEETYITWMFSNNGAPVVFRGRWDEEKQTLYQSSSPDKDGLTTHSVSKIVSDDRIEWAVMIRNEDGETQGKLSGVDTRK